MAAVSCLLGVLSWPPCPRALNGCIKQLGEFGVIHSFFGPDRASPGRTGMVPDVFSFHSR